MFFMQVVSTASLRMDSAQISANSGAASVSCMCRICAIAPSTTPSTTSGLLRIDANILASSRAVGLADRLDDRFLRGEIAVERARAHAGLGADLLHRGALEAGAHETGLGGIEDALDLLIAALGARQRMLVGILADAHFTEEVESFH